jgi:glycosyltransferase involved in cell wall biosynthesis
MRIALVSSEYPPFRGGGIGTYVKVVSDALVRAGHEVHVVTNRYGFGSTDPRHSQPVHRDGGLWVHRIDAMTDDWKPKPRGDDVGSQLCTYWSPFLYFAERVAEELARIHQEHTLDVAEFPECGAEGYGVIRRRRQRLGFEDLPITVTLHSPIEDIYRYNLYSRYEVGFQRRSAMEEYSIRWADTLSSPSRLLASIIRERFGLDEDGPPCAVLAYPMDFDNLPALSAETRAAGRETLLFVGRLEQRKGVKSLVDAAVRVMATRPTLEVELVGTDCPAGEAPVMMTELLHSRIPDALQDRFHFVGSLPREAIFARYAAATACVFPAPWDNFPLTCVEAMASGGCVIGSDYSGMADMIEHERSGLLFRAGDVSALTAAIARVLDDPALAARLRAAAPGRIRAVCDPDAGVREHIAHYERTIERHRRREGLRPRAALSSVRVAVLVPGAGPPEALRQTVESAMAAGRDAGVTVEVDIAEDVGQPSGAPTRNGVLGHDVALRRWRAERLAVRNPDYALVLWPGDTISRDYLSVTLAALAANEDAAWVTSWAGAETAGGVPYAGLDFTLPLDVVAHHPVPFAVIRHRALVAVGGWNLDLPLGWSDWDLWLAFAGAGLEGLVLPRWLGRYAARPERTLWPPPTLEARSIVLDAIVARSPEIFARHGAMLWRYRIMNSIELVPEPARDGVARPPAWREWWKLTKACLGRQYPPVARLYRRLRSGANP